MLARQAEFLAILAKEQNLISAAVNSVASNWAIKNPGEPSACRIVAYSPLVKSGTSFVSS